MSKKHIFKKHMGNLKVHAKLEFPSFLMTTIGITIYAIGVMWFTVPYNFPDSGLIGIALLLKYTIGLTPSIFYLLANVGLMAWGRRELPKRFILWTSYNIFMFSFLLDILGRVHLPMIENMFLVAITGGIIKGIGIGMIFRCGTSSGGTDIIIAVIRKRFGIEMGRYSFYLNMIILAASINIVGLEKLLYGLVAGYVAGETTDSVLTSFDKRRLVFIVGTKESEQDIIQYISDNLKRGSTVFESRGGYSNQESSTLMCLLTPRQTMDLKRYIARNHLRYFVVVAEASEVLGAGFKNWEKI